MTTENESEIQKIPHRVSERCDRIHPLDVENVIRKEQMRNQPDPVPGTCRFCGHRFAHTHVKLDCGTVDLNMPILQCDKVAKMAKAHLDKLDREKRERKTPTSKDAQRQTRGEL